VQSVNDDGMAELSWCVPRPLTGMSSRHGSPLLCLIAATNNIQPGNLSYSHIMSQVGSAHHAGAAFNTQTLNATPTNLLQQTLLPYSLPQLASYSLQRPSSYSQGGPTDQQQQQSAHGHLSRQHSAEFMPSIATASLLQQQVGNGLHLGGAGGVGHTTSYNLLMNYMTQVITNYRV
jgi:hypothetical protein